MIAVLVSVDKSNMCLTVGAMPLAAEAAVFPTVAVAEDHIWSHPAELTM